MKDNDSPVTANDLAAYTVDSIATFCTKLASEGVPFALIIFALDVNHAIAIKMAMDQTRTLSSEGAQGG